MIVLSPNGLIISGEKILIDPAMQGTDFDWNSLGNMHGVLGCSLVYDSKAKKMHGYLDASASELGTDVSRNQHKHPLIIIRNNIEA